MRHAAAIFVLLLAGCDGCKDPPAPPQTKKTVPTARDVIEPPDAAVLDRILGESAPVQGKAGKARWAAPRCTLRYTWSTRQTAEVGPGRPPTTIDLNVELLAKPRDSGAVFEVIKVDRSLGHDDVVKTRPIDTGHWRPAEATTDGLAWNSDAPLWNKHTTLPPLRWLFPRMPRDKTEDYPAEDTRISITLDHWIGEAAVLEASWRIEEEKFEPMESRRIERWIARFHVSHEGVLLRAALAATTHHWWSPAHDQSNENNGAIEQHLRLVEGCAPD